MQKLKVIQARFHEMRQLRRISNMSHLKINKNRKKLLLDGKGKLIFGRIQ